MNPRQWQLKCESGLLEHEMSVGNFKAGAHLMQIQVWSIMLWRAGQRHNAQLQLGEQWQHPIQHLHQSFTKAAHAQVQVPAQLRPQSTDMTKL